MYDGYVCMKCGSTNCEYVTKQYHFGGSSKTKIKPNLNPFKPFTVATVETKTNPGYVDTVQYYECKNCGFVYNPDTEKHNKIFLWCVAIFLIIMFFV